MGIFRRRRDREAAGPAAPEDQPPPAAPPGEPGPPAPARLDPQTQQLADSAASFLGEAAGEERVAEGKIWTTQSYDVGYLLVTKSAAARFLQIGFGERFDLADIRGGVTVGDGGTVAEVGNVTAVSFRLHTPGDPEHFTRPVSFFCTPKSGLAEAFLAAAGPPPE